VRRIVAVHVLALAYVALLIVALGVPLKESRGAAAYRRQHHALSLGMPPSLRARVRDASLNVILFIPLGILGRRSLRQSGVAPLPTLLVIVGGSMALSFTMEALQHVIPGRYSSLLDVMTNTAGATIGVTGGMAVQAWSRLRSVGTLS
jgi:VanZ family protein